MKKTYIAPKTEIVILSDNDILAVSTLFLSFKEKNGEDIMSVDFGNLLG